MQLNMVALAVLLAATVIGQVGAPPPGLSNQTLLPQPFSVLKPLNGSTYPGSSLSSGGAQSFQGAFVLGETAFFQAYTPDAGHEFWRSDGTAAGTSMLRDICPGADDTFKTAYAALGTQLVFLADDCATGKELWTSDGTTAGTRRLKDVNPGAASSDPDSLVVVGDTLFFRATSGTDQSIWKSNGTEAGTAALPISGTPVGALGGSLIFMVYASSACSLKLFDGSGVIQLAPICPIDGTIAAGETRFYFTAETAANGKELWTSDGTAAGTSMLADLNPGVPDANPVQLTISAHDSLYFSATDGILGHELWWTNGTGEPIRLKDINRGTGGSSPDNLTMWNNILFFRAYNGEQTELWHHSFSDGVRMVSDLTPAPGVSSFPTWLTATAGGLFFVARDTTSARALYKTDGTGAGTVFVKDFSATAQEASSLTAFGSGILFHGNDGTNGGEPWRSDGTPAGTAMIKDIVGTTSREVRPFFPAHVANRLFYMGYNLAPNPTESYTLYSSNGTVAGTQALTGVELFTPDDRATAPVSFNNALFFPSRQNGSSTGNELWRSDGSVAGTKIFLDVYPGVNSSSPAWLQPSGGTLFFSAEQSSTGVELWKTTGTPETTTLLKDIDGGTDGSYPRYLTADGNGGVYFSATDRVSGSELWHSDGTATGTRRVLDVRVGNGSSSPENLVMAGDLLFFSADDGLAGRELWVSDGTAEGTRRRSDSAPGSTGTDFGSYRQPFVPIANRIFFVASTPPFGAELWTSDGTEEGTRIVKDVYAGSGTSMPADLVALNGLLYFSATGADGTRTLWQSDGTTANTRPVSGGSGAPINPHNLSAINGMLYFSASDQAGIAGQELWASDGTPAGTRMLQNLNPGAMNSNPYAIVAVDRRMYLSAYAPGDGIQLWAAPMQYRISVPIIVR